MKVLVRAYFEEAKWLHQNYTPKMDEYMSVALTTSYFLLSVVSFVGMADIVTKDSLDWIFNDSKSFHALLLLGRLIDDMKSHKFEQKRGRIASAVECYMTEHGATEEETTIECTKQLNDAWNDINEEWLILTIPRHLLLRIPRHHS
ncbi:(-)-germacrene D synthase-like [Pyrus ussuriensis x Pyrus communis]|uniref:(-)-germacrene D synthase-like n=1 Tax=Pyrus ussuriensis x Pyrus communis TaxID=2448454 RepID=A0A5N5G599_9ROSA|nr:(-)-germacrene D synthase-like [Pyrus ussuriensis x Pyrus communis]